MVGRWKRSGVSPMSMVLTSSPHRCCTPKTNRGIPTFLTGHFRGGLVDVSAVDTGLPSASAQRGSCGAARRPHPRFAPTGPAQLLIGAWRLWSDVGSGPGLVRAAPTPRGAGATGQGLCVLHEGPPYLEYPHPSSSSTRASCIATRRRRTPPELLRAASPAPGGKARCGNRGRSISPLRGPAPEEDSPPAPGPSLKPPRSRGQSGGTGGVRMRGSRLSLTLECVPCRTREPRRFP